MSNALFPALPGLSWSVIKAPVMRTIVHETVSGKESRLALMAAPLWQYTLTYEVIRSGSTYTEFQTLVDFWLQRQGSFDTFLYTDPNDYAVSGQAFGTGNGTTTAFQLLRSFMPGGFLEPIQNLNGPATISVGGTTEPSAPLTSPAAPTLGSTAGGSLGATTYYVKITYVGPTGETLGSTEANLAVAANNVLTVTSPSALTGATGWNVYVSTTTNTETKQNGGTPIAIGTNWTEPTSGLVAGSALPGSNTTGWSVSSTGIVTFNAAPANGVALTWSGSFYYRLRFKQDTSDFEQFAYNYWSLKKLELISVKL